MDDILSRRAQRGAGGIRLGHHHLIRLRPGRAGSAYAQIVFNRLQLRPQPVDHIGVLVFKYQYPGGAVLQDVFDLRGSKPKIDRCADVTGQLARAVYVEILVAIHRQDRDAVLMAHAARIKCR
ncbi:hypothetical protein D3C79_898720 [compost metagenome]